MSEKVPTAREVDALIQRFAEAQQAVTAAQATAAEKAKVAGLLKDELIAMVEAHGAQYTESSKRLSGARHFATTTIGKMIQVNDAAVDKLREHLEGGEQPELAEKFFSQRVTYQLVKGPADVLRELTLPAKARRKLQQMIALCFTVKAKAASLKVDLAEAA